MPYEECSKLECACARNPKIYVFCEPGGFEPGDVIGHALAEDGTGLCSHLSSNPSFSRHDMGITSDWKHDIYKDHYPDGYELEWIETKDLDTHPGFIAAYDLNQEKEKTGESNGR
jgi:hypothetical protein